MLRSSNPFSARACCVLTTVKWWILKDFKIKTSFLRLVGLGSAALSVVCCMIYSTQEWGMTVSQVSPCLQVLGLHSGSFAFSYSQHWALLTVSAVYKRGLFSNRNSLAGWHPNAQNQRCFGFQIFLIVAHLHIHDGVSWWWNSSLNIKFIYNSYIPYIQNLKVILCNFKIVFFMKPSSTLQVCDIIFQILKNFRLQAFRLGRHRLYIPRKVWDVFHMTNTFSNSLSTHPPVSNTCHSHSHEPHLSPFPGVRFFNHNPSSPPSFRPLPLPQCQ